MFLIFCAGHHDMCAATSLALASFLAKDAEVEVPDTWEEVPDGGMLVDVEPGSDEFLTVEVSCAVGLLYVMFGPGL